LLLTNREVFHICIGIDGEIVLLRQFTDLLAGDVEVEEETVAGFCAEDDIFCNGKDRHEHKVLMNHADPAPDRVAWSADPHWLATDQHLA
jgi:hypothetical protein